MNLKRPVNRGFDMTPLTVFFMRAALSIGASLLLNQLYFGGFDWMRIGLLAGFMLLVAYVFEAFRRRGERK
jgi:hypothetical protein